MSGVIVEVPSGRMLRVLQDELFRPEFTCYDHKTGEKVEVEKDSDDYEEILRAFGFEELY